VVCGTDEKSEIFEKRAGHRVDQFLNVLIIFVSAGVALKGGERYVNRYLEVWGGMVGGVWGREKKRNE
jgi:hypothetical protein